MKNHSLNFLDLVNESLKEIGECDVYQVKNMQEQNEAFHLIDVREDREWIQGHIPGAIHLGKAIIERDIEKVIEDKEILIVLYCQGGFRSALAGKNLKKMGYEKFFLCREVSETGLIINTLLKFLIDGGGNNHAT